MGKGEIARYEQFLLFPQCFQKACFPGASNGVIVWEWVKEYKLYFWLNGGQKSRAGFKMHINFTLYHTIQTF